MFKFPTAAAALLAASAAAVMAQTGPAPSPVPAAASESNPDAVVAAAEARAVATQLAAQLETTYVFPDIARRYAESLRAKAGGGAYDEVGTRGALAERLTADLRAVSPDNHLRVLAGRPGPGGPGPRRVVVRAGGDGSAGAAQPRPAPMARPEAVEQARWVAPGVAFVRLNLFPGSPEVVEAARKFMTDHSEAKTIIFDIRTHRGGGLAEMDAMFPYLFAKPTTLVTMDTRASVDRERGNPAGDAMLRKVPTKEDVVRREHYVTPHASEKRLFGAKVFVLTSNFTGSAAEHFALSLKRTKRATLIGEATGGAGHYGGFQPVGEHFSVFIPVGRTFDPDTGKGWETVGVPPDIAVPAERALYEALVRSGVAPAEAERLSEELKPSGPMRRPQPRQG